MERTPSTSRVGGRSRSAPLGGADSPAHAAIRELVRVSGLIRRLSEPQFAQHRLTTTQWGVLRALSRLEQRGAPEPRMHELGAELLVQPPSLSATLDRMVRAGLVTRRSDPDDHRSRRIAMTDVGRTRLTNALGDHRAWIRRLTAVLTPSEQSRLHDLLCKLSEHLMEMSDDPLNSEHARPRGRAKRSRNPE